MAGGLWNRGDVYVIEGVPPLGSAHYRHGICRAARVGTTAYPDDAGDASGVGVGLAASRFLATCKRRRSRSRWQFPFNRAGKPLDSTHASWVGAGAAAQEWLRAFGIHVDAGCHSRGNCIRWRGTHRNGCIAPAPRVCSSLDGAFRVALAARRSTKAVACRLTARWPLWAVREHREKKHSCHRYELVRNNHVQASRHNLMATPLLQDHDLKAPATCWMYWPAASPKRQHDRPSQSPYCKLQRSRPNPTEHS